LLQDANKNKGGKIFRKTFIFYELFEVIF